jgi:hypothetical protein
MHRISVGTALLIDWRWLSSGRPNDSDVGDETQLKHSTKY